VNILTRQTNSVVITTGTAIVTFLTIAGADLAILEHNLVNAAPEPPVATEPELEINVTGKRGLDLPKSTPIYTIDRQQIDRQGAKNVADAIKNLPGFAINDVGYGADIHTGTYYRGASNNQFIILLNGRPIGTNINTYHGATDLNSIPVDAITYGRLRQRSDRIVERCQ
jgi:vitamin B12 transporter